MDRPPPVAVRALAGAVAVLLMAGVLAATARSGGAPPASEVLDRARRFLAGGPSLTFSGAGRFEPGPDAATPSGAAASIAGLRVEGRTAGDRYRYSVRSQDRTGEVVLIGPEAYYRQAPRPEDLPSQRWSARLDPGVTGPLTGMYRPAGLQTPVPRSAVDLAAPTLLAPLVRALAEARVLRRDGAVTVLGGRASAARVVTGGVPGVERVDVEVSADREGVVRTVAVRTAVDGGAAVVDYRLAAEPVEIDAPPPEQVDTTAGIDEARVAAYRRVAPRQPASLPGGWVLEKARTVLVANAPPECEQLELDYGRPGADSGYLYLFQLPAVCVGTVTAPESAPFAAGPHQGTVVVDGARGTLRARITVGDSVMEAQTDLSPEALAAVLARLTPLDLARPPQPDPGIRGS